MDSLLMMLGLLFFVYVLIEGVYMIVSALVMEEAWNAPLLVQLVRNRDD